MLLQCGRSDATRLYHTLGGKRLPMVVFYRCLLASILPTDVQRVLYIDCDTLILSDLSPLWNAPLDDHPLAAVADEPVEINPAHAQRLQYEVSDNYFNGGVILFNLDYWRKHNLEETCRDFYQKYPERIRYNDQDLLNGLFHKSRILLPARWNVQSNFYRRKKVNRYQDNQDFCKQCSTLVYCTTLHESPGSYIARIP